MRMHTLIRKTRTVIKDPKSLLINTLQFLSPLMSDKLYLKLLFPLSTGYRLNLKNPRTYNQKLNWLKLYYRTPLLSRLSDKYEAKNYVKEMIGEEYVVKNYGVWNSFDEIDFDSLPSQFVLKTTHDSGGLVICKDKSQLDFDKAKMKLNKHLKTNLYYKYREWPYKNVKPRIIAEELLEYESETGLLDYKFICFNGEPKLLLVCSERQTGTVKFDYFDIHFNHLDVVQDPGQSQNRPKKPKEYDKMITLAKKLSEGLPPYVRIDFYNINDKILFGEFTFTGGAGVIPFKPEKWDYEFGSWIDLSKCVGDKGSA